LYSGDRVLDQVRTAYFRQFHRLLLIDLNGQMMADLERLPANPDAGAPYDPAYRTLKAHLMITSGSCAVDSPFLSRQLRDVRARIASDAGSEWQALADRQIDFYADELPRGNPLRLTEDIEGRERARQYLRQIKGIDRFYASILANAEKSLGKSSRLSDLASNYTQVLTGPDEVSAAFSREGWAYLEKASKEVNAAALGEPCVLGGASALVADWKENTETAQAVQRMFLRNYVDHWRKFVEGFSVTKFTSAGDAARRLEILADHKSPLLAVFAMTANHTSFLAPAAQTDAGVVQKSINKLAASFKKAETETKAVVGARAEAPDSLNNPADITPYFQPVHAVEPPGSETWVVDKNAAYIDTLAQLRHSMQDIDQGARNPDPAVHQLARQNYEKAMDTVRQIARGFKPVGVGGLDTTVEHLLEEPILLTKPFIIYDMEKPGLDKLNRDLRNFCTSERNTLRKYPFESSSAVDATLEEFAGLFDPVKGAVWTFQRQSLADLAVKEGSLWKPKDPTGKPQITQELLVFLNRAQSIVEIFYAGGGTQMQFNYTLRPRLDIRLKEFTLELEIDGRPHQWTNSVQHQFNWPPPPATKNAGAVARLRTTANVGIPFASRGGIWGIFRILGDAEPRELNAHVVEWRYTSSGVGRRELIDPAPVQLEIVEPRGQDVFNPRFWDGLRCPSRAVQ
jgi:type VI secretion system protein ImpL